MRKLGVLVMTFIALAAILRASGVDDPCCDRTAAIIMQCSLVRQTCPDDGMVTLDAANAEGKNPRETKRMTTETAPKGYQQERETERGKIPHTPL